MSEVNKLYSINLINVFTVKVICVCFPKLVKYFKSYEINGVNLFQYILIIYILEIYKI